MTATVYAVQSVLGTTDCQFVPAASRPSRWLPDGGSRALWHSMCDLAVDIEIDWATGSETCAAPLDLGSITLSRMSPANAAVRRFGVVDGYRRLMSVVMLLAALGQGAQARGDLPGAERIRDKYLINRHARYPGDRWRLSPDALDAGGWGELMTGLAGPDDRLTAAAEWVDRWYSMAPGGEVSQATYRLERAVTGWTRLEERVEDRTPE